MIGSDLIRPPLWILCLALLIAGCGSTVSKDSPVQGRTFQPEDMAKSDVDMVTEVHLRLTLDHLHRLMEKLYRRNPGEWRRHGSADRESAVARVFGPERQESFPELGGRRSIDAMRLAFDDRYSGDRVLALVEGLRGMVLDAYDGKQAFYLFDKLDPQKLYNAARNIEIVVWKLSHDRKADGELYLLTNEGAGPIPNLSFERLFGKIIAYQDGMAQIVADTTSRRIKTVIQSVASAVFIPF